jgi:3-deoxy-7-phosphoheptulonate synthase
MSGYAESWRDRPAAQQPDWPDRAALAAVTGDLRGRSPLASGEECDRLQARLAEVALGQGFVLQGGDCAETFSGASARVVRRKLNLLRQMAMVLTHVTSLPVVQIGRMAGQFAKPRSQATETRGTQTLPVYRGEAVNGREFTERARRPDPARLRQAYRASAVTLAILRLLTTDTDAERSLARSWRRDMARHALLGCRHDLLAAEIDAVLRYARGLASTGPNGAFYTSHEGLLLEYESALVRRGTGGWYGSSGHMLWIGERTRDLDGAHVEFAATIGNPVGVKLGPTATPEVVRGLVDRLDPERRPGRLTFIARLGAARVRQVLPDLVTAAEEAGARVVWLCDPMHGNTFQTRAGHKTRRFEEIMDEIAGFFEVHRRLGSHPGGLHLELTGEDVTECLGGVPDLRPEHLRHHYETACDPRLSRQQALELAFVVAEQYRRCSGQPAPGRPAPPVRDLPGAAGPMVVRDLPVGLPPVRDLPGAAVAERRSTA